MIIEFDHISNHQSDRKHSSTDNTHIYTMLIKSRADPNMKKRHPFIVLQSHQSVCESSTKWTLYSTCIWMKQSIVLYVGRTNHFIHSFIHLQLRSACAAYTLNCVNGSLFLPLHFFSFFHFFFHSLVDTFECTHTLFYCHRQCMLYTVHMYWKMRSQIFYSARCVWFKRVVMPLLIFNFICTDYTGCSICMARRGCRCCHKITVYMQCMQCFIILLNAMSSLSRGIFSCSERITHTHTARNEWTKSFIFLRQLGRKTLHHYICRVFVCVCVSVLFI